MQGFPGPNLLLTLTFDGPAPHSAQWLVCQRVITQPPRKPLKCKGENRPVSGVSKDLFGHIYPGAA